MLSKYNLYVGNLKEYLSDDYKWLWNTTYWTKTFADEQITFRVEHEKNYKIKYVTVNNKLGNSVTFKEEQLIQNEDGTISINSFTMPSNDVTIKVGFEIVNPKTGVSNPIYILLLGLLISGITYFILTKKGNTELNI